MSPAAAPGRLRVWRAGAFAVVVLIVYEVPGEISRKEKRFSAHVRKCIAHGEKRVVARELLSNFGQTINMKPYIVCMWVE